MLPVNTTVVVYITVVQYSTVRVVVLGRFVNESSRGFVA